MRTSSKVTSRGVPSVAIVVNNRSESRRDENGSAGPGDVLLPATSLRLARHVRKGKQPGQQRQRLLGAIGMGVGLYAA